MGVLGTVFVLEATEGPATDQRFQATVPMVRSPNTYTMDSEIAVTEPRRIRVRGSMSLRPRPVVYVDGIRLDDSSEMLQRLNPDRIDHIEIIKGSAAQVKYGSEAENGAIQIFLKPADESDNRGSDGGR